MSDINNPCPHCETNIQYPQTLIGEVIICPHCEKSVSLTKHNVVTDQAHEGSSEEADKANIYILHEGQEYGPYTKANLIQYIAEGSVSIDAKARNDTNPGWVALNHWRTFHDVAQARLEASNKDDISQQADSIKHDSAWMFIIGIAWIIGDHLPESGVSWGFNKKHVAVLHVMSGIFWIASSYSLLHSKLGKDKYLLGLIAPTLVWLVATLGSDPVYDYLFPPGRQFGSIAAFSSFIFIFIWYTPFIYFPFISDSLLHKSVFVARKLRRRNRIRDMFGVLLHCFMSLIVVLLISFDAFDISVIITKNLKLDYIYIRVLLFIIVITYHQIKLGGSEI